MRALKRILLNLGFLVLYFAVMLPPSFAEGRLGQCSFGAIAFLLSIAMTIISVSACGIIGKKSLLFIRCLSVVIALWFILSQILFLVFERPDFAKDIADYWVGAVIFVLLVILQGFCNRKSFASLLFGHSPDASRPT
jgi:hypothetical protein